MKEHCNGTKLEHFFARQVAVDVCRSASRRSVVQRSIVGNPTHGLASNGRPRNEPMQNSAFVARSCAKLWSPLARSQAPSVGAWLQRNPANHLGCIKWDIMKKPTNWCRISSINSLLDNFLKHALLGTSPNPIKKTFLSR